jgi:hypothetical protein
MNYPCRTISIRKLIITNSGKVNGLCDKCHTSNCTNPIEKMTVSEMGINKERRICMKNSIPSIVISCEGFSGKDDDINNDIEEE